MITGTVSDSTGALIPGARIVLTNTNTGANSDTVTTGTGNYTLLSLSAGTYSLKVAHPGFGVYEQTKIQVQVAVTTRVEIVLAIGSAAETIRVNAESTQLRTESAEQSSTITGKQINELPINFGIGAGAIRNPLSFAQMTPGATFNGWNNISINGGNNNFKVMFEGQESDSARQTRVSDELQPSVESIEQFTLQTSNFSAEFGRVGNGGVYNFTSKSGTNAFHGSAYLYFENTFLNAGIPFTNDGKGGHIKVVKHLADYGGSLGGPVLIPKLYSGKNKTFFFVNIEKYRDRESLYAGTSTVPNSAYLAGNLSNNLAVTANRNLGNDFAGRPIIQNAIYDPATQVIDPTGRRVLNTFPNNIIPPSRIDPAAAKILAFLPKPNLGNDAYVNNFTQSGAFFKLQQIPSLKIDHNFSDRSKISGYVGTQNTDKSNGVDGLPDVLSRVRIQNIWSMTSRVNYDHTLSPTLLLHLGAGFIRYRNPDTVPPISFEFDPTKVGITGAPGTGFPRLGPIGDSILGGMALPFGTGNRTLLFDQKATGVASLSWVHGNHTTKFGGDWKLETTSPLTYNNLTPTFNFSGAQTAQPLYGQVLPNGTGTGSAWASFLLGLYDNASAGNASTPQNRRKSLAVYAQDTWKLTRKLTFDYGVRWDYQGPLGELWDRPSTFSPTTPNPNANGLLGAVIYAGEGKGRCNCALVPAYRKAFAPRLGAAYQLNPKTVLRAGWGLVYGPLSPTAVAPSTASMGFNVVNLPSPGNGVAAGSLSRPLVLDQNLLYGAAYDAGLTFVPGAAVPAAPALVDRNGGRPSRVNQWNVSIQREVAKDIVVEASYLGNRTVWQNAGGGGNGTYSVGNLVNYNAVDPATLARFGLGDLTNPATRTLLNSTITSAGAVAAGFKLPYPGFPTNGTVLQTLRPYPQFSGVGQLFAPLGASWYDALQVKATKRFSYGLTATLAYAFSKTLDNATNAGSIYDRKSFKGLSPNYLPHVTSLSVNYTVPAYGFVKQNRLAKAFLSGWRLGTISTWQSGTLLNTPGSNNSIGGFLSTGYTRQTRVPGVPLYLKDINCGCIDPSQETVLNPAAWQDQTAGVPGSNIAYFNDFRGQRRPIISGGIGKEFRIQEKVTMSLRAEFFNLLNQNLSISDPSTGSPAPPPPPP
ncbi:MAG: TonB-dependent receptor, partial [Acidobacteria bacterium]|nr:TonB-dependent receptor [Acidobacteriota bacterium]